ncbi:Spy/CpxP family protein refolding chaperone [Leptothermofonsia sp. ETS-13]|uniref:Spy/CpxP family protein refolding chaperone n=1 Tax=Leptothermofonsia sp. ETS-13 TaxID=3035696 RepID=UPI003BA3863E
MTKKLFLLPGAIALILAATPGLPVFSQAVPPAPATRMEKWGEKLNLTEEQKTQLKQIRASTRAQIEAVLTEEQKTQLQTARQQRQKLGKNFSSLNLTDEQKSKIRAIRQEARKQMNAVLTAEQHQQLQRQREQKRQQRSTQTSI